MKFSDRKLAGLQPKEHPYDIREQDGFAVCVYPSGKVSFLFIYNYQGKRKRLIIGAYPMAYSLAEAREKHRELYKIYKQGGDPSRQQSGMTVKDLAQKFLSEYVAKRNTSRTLENRKGQLQNHVYSAIGETAIDCVKRADIHLCLNHYQKNNHATGYNHLLGTIKKMFNWAIERELCENNPALTVKNLQTQPSQNVLADKDIKLILADSGDTANILKLCLYTGCRPGEAQNMRCKDIVDGWWECPQNKGGGSGVRRTYLTPSATALVGKGNGRAFTLKSQTGLAQYVRRKKYSFKPHDIRRTVATRLARLGYSDESIHRFLGHSVGRLTRTYNVHRYDDELREMATAWESELQKIYPPL